MLGFKLRIKFFITFPLRYSLYTIIQDIYINYQNHEFTMKKQETLAAIAKDSGVQKKKEQMNFQQPYT